MAQRAENRVQQRVQIPAEVFGQKPQHEIAALLKQLVLASVAPVRDPVGEMLRTIQLHCHAITRAQVEQNLALKMRDGPFLADLRPLLATGEAWDPMAAEALISERLVTLLPGDAWKGEDR